MEFTFYSSEERETSRSVIYTIRSYIMWTKRKYVGGMESV